MADDIKIRVGVSNNVKAGMSGVIRDIEKSVPSGKAAGKGFMESFMKGMRGDIAGAMQGFQESMGAGMTGIKAKALVWGGGIATALFAGIKAGQMLDNTFGISDKLGNYFASKYGEVEDESLKGFRKAQLAYRKTKMDPNAIEKQEGESDASVKKRKEIADLEKNLGTLKSSVTEGIQGAEADTVGKWISYTEERIAKSKEELEKIAELDAKIKAVESDNKAIADLAGDERAAQFEARREDRNWKRLEKDAGFTSDVASRMMGRGDRGAAEEADRASRLAFDDDFRRQEKQVDRQESRMRERQRKLEARASDPDQRRYSPQLQRVFAAEQKQQQIQQFAAQAKKKEADAWQAQIDAYEQAKKTAENTALLADLNKRLLTLK